MLVNGFVAKVQEMCGIEDRAVANMYKAPILYSPELKQTNTKKGSKAFLVCHLNLRIELTAVITIGEIG